MSKAIMTVELVLLVAIVLVAAALVAIAEVVVEIREYLKKLPKCRDTEETCQECLHSAVCINDPECIFIWCTRENKFCSRYTWCDEYEKRRAIKNQEEEHEEQRIKEG